MTSRTPRTYRKQKRADAERATRLRITEAAVTLHGTVGPAKSTVTDVAKLAGVSRMTVYNHFPTEVDLFRACSSHWAEQHPFPDPAGWSGADPAERLEAGLTELYAWYGINRSMLGNVFRDVPSVPALAEVMGGLWEDYVTAVVGALARGWSLEACEPAELDAMLRLAVDFGSWHVLARSGMTYTNAAALMSRLVSGALLDSAAS